MYISPILDDLNMVAVNIHATAEDIQHLDSTDRPVAPFRTKTFRKTRPSIAGPDEPEAPFPIKLAGPVQHGFGRGGKDLGCPTGSSHSSDSVHAI